jgi:predicted GIY-YIG superfamily endonuclease
MLILTGIGNWTMAVSRPATSSQNAGIPYNPAGSTRFVNFTTSKETRWKTDQRRCHVNWAVCDSDWEAELCRAAEAHPRVRAYVKNHSIGFEVPYLLDSTPKRYLPDFIVQVDDGRGPRDGRDLLNLVVEIKGYRGEDAKEKAATMDAYWVPAVNNLGRYGRWAFAELTSIYAIPAAFDAPPLEPRETMIEAYLYLLRCADGSYYVGTTRGSLEQRFAEHQTGAFGGYTSARWPVTLVFHQYFQRIEDAIAAERQVKGWRREKKETLIRGDFAALPALSRRAAKPSSARRPCADRG